MGWVAAIVVLAVAGGASFGWWLRGVTETTRPAAGLAGLARAVAPVPSAVDDGDNRELQGALFDSWMNSLMLAARARSLESVIEEMQAGDVEPHELVRGVVSEMSESELELTIAMATDFSSEDLEDVEDVRAFATRLADIAMDGLIVDASDETGNAEVVFSPSTDPAEARDRFSEDEGRIYAIFTTEGYDLPTVMLKWFRVDEPQLMLFRRFKIVVGRDAGWIWVDGEHEWDPGDYQVDIYSGDEEMTRLGVGRYVVEPFDR